MATRIGDETKDRIAAAWPALIAAVADGSNIGEVCAKAGVTRDQVRVYRIADAERNKEWELAREQSAEAFADQIHDIVNNIGADSNAARVRIQALQWLAAKRNPRQYSDKSSVDVNVRTVDLTAIIRDANARLQAGRVIQGEVVRQAISAPQHADSDAQSIDDLM